MGRYAQEWYVDDTDTIELTIRDGNGVIVPLVSQTFTMAVDSLETPANPSVTQLFTIAGIYVDAACGIVGFTPTAANAAQAPGTYYWSVLMASPKRKTLFKDEFIFLEALAQL
jgi:hypothetical protein